MSMRQRIASILLLLTALAGLVFSGLLFYTSAKLTAGVSAATLCHIGETFDCAPALVSQYSTVGGIPLPVFAGGFYFSVLGVIGAMFFAGEQRESAIKAAARYLTITFTMAVGVTIFLGSVMFTQLDATCPFCLGLYISSAVGFVSAWLLGPRWRDSDNGIAGAAMEMVTNRAVISALIVFVVAAGTALLSYGSFVERFAAENAEAEREAAEQVELAFQGDVEFDLDGLPRLGPADAPIKLVEFSDFECPFCGKFSETIHEIHEAYPEEVAIYFSHFPLDGSCNPAAGGMHPSACLAATASLCAQQQEKFWPMHDELFAWFAELREAGERRKLTEDDLLEMAGDIGLQPETFLVCLNTPENTNRVTLQVARGSKAGVKSTPTWLINGNRQAGARSFDYVRTLVDRLLELRARESAANTEAPAAPQTP